MRLNGGYLDVEAGEAYTFMVGAMTHGEFKFKAIREWIAGNLKRL